MAEIKNIITAMAETKNIITAMAENIYIYYYCYG